MLSINILLLLVSVGIASTYGQPLKTTNTSLPMTSESPLMEAQSKQIQEAEDIPIKKNTHVVTLFKAIFPDHALKADSSEVTSSSTTTNSNFKESAFFEGLKEISTEDSTAIPLDCEDYEDTDEDEDPEGLGPRLSATLLKVLTF
nr:uncharacterized protein LOC108083679 [Drosophila kikkawai]